MSEITKITVAVTLATLLAGTQAQAGSHSTNQNLRAKKSGIDYIITGSNAGAVDPGTTAPADPNASGCVLCYHRDLLNRRGAGANTDQPFPGE